MVDENYMSNAEVEMEILRNSDPYKYDALVGTGYLQDPFNQVGIDYRDEAEPKHSQPRTTKAIIVPQKQNRPPKQKRLLLVIIIILTVLISIGDIALAISLFH
jgi:hypothetical protein